MGYLSASKLTFGPTWGAMSAEEQLAEQVAALEIVATCGGEMRAQYVLVSDGCLLSVVEYPDEIAAWKSASAIQQRGAFVLQVQRAMTLEDVLGMNDEVRALAGK